LPRHLTAYAAFAERCPRHLAASGRELSHGNNIQHRAMLPGRSETVICGTRPARRDGGQ
jgi:hypothetical protein